MSKKQSSGNQLTGGTGDVNPQYMHGRVATSAANTAAEVTLGTPIVRVGPQTGGSAVIMEILKIWVQVPVADLDNAAATVRETTVGFSTVSSGATPAVPAFDNPRLFALFDHQVRNAFTAAGTGTLDVFNGPVCIDLTDGAGHGILIATDNIFVTVDTAGFTAVATALFKILYRFKKVSLVEYIGIVQSQQ